MPVTGMGVSASETTIGAIAGVESITGGGISVNFEEAARVGDTNKVSEQVPINNTGKPVTVVCDYSDALYTKLEAAALAHTEGTWTFTKASGATCGPAVGFVEDPGDSMEDGVKISKLTFVIRPKTYFDFNEAA